MREHYKFLEAQQGEVVTQLNSDIENLERELNKKKAEILDLDDKRIYKSQNETPKNKYEVLLRNTLKLYEEEYNRAETLSSMTSGFDFNSMINLERDGMRLNDRVSSSARYETAIKLCEEITKLDSVYVTYERNFFIDPKTFIPYNLKFDPLVESKSRYYEDGNLFFGMLTKPGKDFLEVPKQYKDITNIKKTKHATSNYLYNFKVDASDDAIIKHTMDNIKKQFKIFVIHRLHFMMNYNDYNDNNISHQLVICGHGYRENEIEEYRKNLKRKPVKDIIAG
jgi:hypothetical protein